MTADAFMVLGYLSVYSLSSLQFTESLDATVVVTFKNFLPRVYIFKNFVLLSHHESVIPNFFAYYRSHDKLK